MACVMAVVAGLFALALAQTGDKVATAQQKYSNYQSDIQKYEKMGAHYMPKINNMSDSKQFEDSYMHKYMDNKYMPHIKNFSNGTQVGDAFRKEYMDNKYMPHIKNFSNGTQVGDAFMKEYAGQWSKYEGQSQHNVSGKAMEKKMTEKYAGPFEKFIKEGEADEKAEKKSEAAADKVKEQKAAVADTASREEKSLAAKRPIAEEAHKAEKKVFEGNPTTAAPPAAAAGSSWPFAMTETKEDINAALRAIGTTVTCAAICGVIFAGMYAHRRSGASALSESLLAAEGDEAVLSQYDQLA